MVETQLCKLRFFNFKNIHLLRKLKNVSGEYKLFEWLKLNFVSCVVHQTRSLGMRIVYFIDIEHMLEVFPLFFQLRLLHQYDMYED